MGSIEGTGTGTFNILGQTVTFNTATQFVNTTGATFILAAGNVVKVVTATSSTPGQLVALRVELLSLTYLTGTSLQVMGVVQGLNTATRTFTLAGSAMTVNNNRGRASSPTVLFDSATVGRTLRVEGIYANGTFIAQRVCIVNSLRGSDVSDGDRDD